jgi:hypothetical protein
MVQIPNPMRACSGIELPWASYIARPSTRQALVELPGADLARSKPGDVVVEVLVRRLDYVVERLACCDTAQAALLVHGEHAARGADDGERALAHVPARRVAPVAFAAWEATRQSTT